MVTYHELENLTQHSWAPLPLGQETPARALISLRAAGNMSLRGCRQRPDRARFCRDAGMEYERTYTLQQKHTQKVVRIDPGLPPRHYATLEADGLVAERAPLWLSVTVADCLPIFLLDRASGACGLVHSGWQGTGIVAAAIELMQHSWGCRSADLCVTIGPGIGACCYAVDPARHALFRERHGPEAAPLRAGRGYLDLRQANLRLLEQAGVPEIHIVTNCTACSPSFHSFRREGAADFQLMLAAIGYPGKQRGTKV